MGFPLAPRKLSASVSCSYYKTVCTYCPHCLTTACQVNRSVRGGGGGGDTQQSFMRGGSAPRSKPLLFYIRFLIEKVPFRIPFIENGTPFIYLRSDFYLTFPLRNPLKYLDESAIRCVCSRYFESPF